MDIFLIAFVFIIPLISLLYYKSNYKKYLKYNGKINTPANVIARNILTQNGLEYVNVEEIKDNKTDHYNISNKIIYLTKETYNNLSITSINIAAFECAHAVLDIKGNILIKIKAILYPLFRFLTAFSYWVVIFGFVLHWDELLYAGIGITMVALLFNFLLLVLEFDASKKAFSYLCSLNLITKEEESISKKILNSYCFKNIAELMINSLRFFTIILVNDVPEDQKQGNDVNNK